MRSFLFFPRLTVSLTSVLFEFIKFCETTYLRLRSVFSKSAFLQLVSALNLRFVMISFNSSSSVLSWAPSMILLIGFDLGGKERASAYVEGCSVTPEPIVSLVNCSLLSGEIPSSVVVAVLLVCSRVVRRLLRNLKPLMSSKESASPYLRSKTSRLAGHGKRLKSRTRPARSSFRISANFYIVSYISSETLERR